MFTLGSYCQWNIKNSPAKWVTIWTKFSLRSSRKWNRFITFSATIHTISVCQVTGFWLLDFALFSKLWHSIRWLFRIFLINDSSVSICPNGNWFFAVLIKIRTTFDSLKTITSGVNLRNRRNNSVFQSTLLSFTIYSFHFFFSSEVLRNWNSLFLHKNTWHIMGYWPRPQS